MDALVIIYIGSTLTNLVGLAAYTYYIRRGDECEKLRERLFEEWQQSEKILLEKKDEEIMNLKLALGRCLQSTKEGK